MTEPASNSDMNKALFINLIMMLTSSAMQQLGKLKDPGAGEVDLEGAQLSIDMLSMFREKTNGNLDKDEQRMLDDALSSLQMNYVQVANEQKKPEPKAKPEEASTAAPAGDDSAEAKDAQPAPESKKEPESGPDPKYHKSYGG